MAQPSWMSAGEYFANVGQRPGTLGLVGDAYMIWDATRSWQRGCDGWIVSCDPPPTA
ncbi:hypothetical protein [Streptomyces sp. NPDC048643]|uniref:hypothetical protein n=1 Tax=Streptomyces sp. NPDC048643 TaxID=3155637 RepID=UPI00344354F1